MKYIITADKHSLTGLSVRIFPHSEQHSDVAEGMKGAPLGAGFCYIDAHGLWFCFGESISMGVASRTHDDSRILNGLMK